jgi:hypothetical protein
MEPRQQSRPILRRERRLPQRSSAAALGVLAVGALALGAAAYGAVAIGRLAIGRVAVRHARFGVLEVEELRVGRLRPMSPGRRGS